MDIVDDDQLTAIDNDHFHWCKGVDNNCSNNKIN